MPLIKVLTIHSELKSARRLGWTTVVDFDPYINTHKEDTVYIRWGNSSPVYDTDSMAIDFPKVINPWQIVHSNCIKNEALAKLATVVLTPPVYEFLVPKGKTAVIRYYSHTGGNNFNVVQGPFEVPECYYATKFIKTNKEFRVWFCGDKTYRCKRVPLKNQKTSQFPCRSEWGYRFKNYDQVPEKLHIQTLNAAKAIGLEVGAADVLEQDKKFYFLELNSAPSIDHWRIEQFFKINLPLLIKQKYP